MTEQLGRFLAISRFFRKSAVKAWVICGHHASFGQMPFFMGKDLKSVINQGVFEGLFRETLW